MKKNPLNRSKQRGVALFVTLVVIVIATLLATEIWFNNTLDIARQYNNYASYQAKHYQKGMVMWASDILRQDFKENANFDNRTESWNQLIAGFQVENAVLSGKLTDMDAKFNLNNLVINNAVNPENLSYFKRILTNLELDIGLADKIIDWIDADQNPRLLGAEDSVYLSKNPSYRTAGQYFQHISEVRLIDGMSDEIYQRLKSFVTVLPIKANQPTKVNINTASSLLLKSLNQSITTKEALALYSNGKAANQNLAAFFRQPAIAYHNLNREELKKIIATRSQWFQAQIGVKMEQSFFQKFALLSRFSPTAIVNQWSDTAFE